MKNTLIRMDKPHIRKVGDLWVCGMLLEFCGETPKSAFTAWLTYGMRG